MGAADASFPHRTLKKGGPWGSLIYCFSEGHLVGVLSPIYEDADSGDPRTGAGS